ncbi:uncharacterized protein B0I36DRAFT_314563 [Microdochium trichocladiopsis]|uniref:Uncharacterized protein n=1 Tax=Microdochium trichocladiopsis TaxID=1682393 RepID=A0A9P8YBI2_9PEZI|nr:uncharacterized protein B0I36DRAFT_314563 [Microdochium trichocladiopsis]KAH7037666.1 hypothetical protein B0I36DRAFT_314563 [Microdochium trichocladiopsis]
MTSSARLRQCGCWNIHTAVIFQEVIITSAGTHHAIPLSCCPSPPRFQPVPDVPLVVLDPLPRVFSEPVGGVASKRDKEKTLKKKRVMASSCHPQQIRLEGTRVPLVSVCSPCAFRPSGKSAGLRVRLVAWVLACETRASRLPPPPAKAASILYATAAPGWSFRRQRRRRRRRPQPETGTIILAA